MNLKIQFYPVFRSIRDTDSSKFSICPTTRYAFDPDLVVVAVDENSPPQVTGQLVHQVQNLAGGKVVLATHAHSAESPAVASAVAALVGAPLPPLLDVDFDSLRWVFLKILRFFTPRLSQMKG